MRGQTAIAPAHMPFFTHRKKSSASFRLPISETAGLPEIGSPAAFRTQDAKEGGAFRPRPLDHYRFGFSRLCGP